MASSHRLPHSGGRDWGHLLRSDRTGGVALLAGTVAALVWANWSGSSYGEAWTSVAPWSRSFGLELSVRDWFNQVLLAPFFVVIGLELRREFLAGELATWRRASVPVLAALGGMALPAVLYAAATAGSPGMRGWGVPMATDIAFALGALALVGARASPRVRVFLMTLAVADDIGSVVVLVCFYSAHVHVAWLAAGAALLAVMVCQRLASDGRAPLQVLLGLAALAAMVFANVEAALVGVAVGVLAPPVSRDDSTGRRRTEGPRHWELRLDPLVNAVVLPVFALANAGVPLAGSGLGSGPALRVLAAVLAARLLGKPTGIMVVKALASRLLTSGYDDGVVGRRLLGAGAMASIGFTIPLLVIHATFPTGPMAAGAIVGLLAASVVGWATGALLLRRR
ncbi:MAG TPA: Na+/H+ antiporter NhaA [Acidimicrobiales bacterium]|nr:Na+/H+ antiporter NhaA [Acidimicrobiales bacterium]